MTDEPQGSVPDLPGNAARGPADPDDRAVAAPQEPYGPAINDAIARGDVQQMKAVAESARRALYATEFQAVTPGNEEEVLRALQDLDDAISRMDRGRGTAQ